MGHSKTDIGDDEISRRRAAERALEAVRVELAEQVAARHEAQVRLRILLTDDSRDNRLLVRAYFKKLPYTIDEAENGAEAVEMFRSGNYDLVLMDVEMPIMDGYSATRAIRAIERETGRRRVPVLALTASVLTAALKKAHDAGCDAHIAKPVKKATLLAAVHKATGDAGVTATALKRERPHESS